MNTQEIAIRKLNAVVLPTPKSSAKASKKSIGAFLKNVSQLGYLFDEKALSIISNLSVNQLNDLHKELIPVLEKIVGADVKYIPTYPNFPEQVMEMSEAELYLNAYLHYVSAVMNDLIGTPTFLPQYEEKVRPHFNEKTKYIVLTSAVEEDILTKVFPALLSTNTSISETDKNILDFIARTYKNKVKDFIPDNIPQKEQLAYLAGLGLKYGIDLENSVKTATDVLRIAVAMSEGDVSLGGKILFKRFSRKERRFLLSLLDKIKNPDEDIKRHAVKWVRLGEILHPGEYRTRFKRAYQAFKVARGEKDVQTFYAKVETALLTGDITTAVTLLKKRPGEFARKLDRLLRTYPTHSSNIIKAFDEVAGDIATPVLLQVKTHFKFREEHENLDLFFPKGSVSKFFIAERSLIPIDKGVCEEIIKVIDDHLLQRFSDLEPLGKVFVDPNLAKINLPFSQRSASESKRLLTRGSRYPFNGNARVIRFFVHWKNLPKKTSNLGEYRLHGQGWSGGHRVDIDLSAVMYDEDWAKLGHISYTNLKAAYSVHSGDITDAPKGAAEFIDIDIKKALEDGVRYVVMVVYSYTGQPFEIIPECYAGWMERKFLNKGKIFEPKTVKNKITLTGDKKSTNPLVIDLKTREVIWVDMNLNTSKAYLQNVEFTEPGINYLGRTITSMKRTTYYDLLSLHGQARGEIVDTPKEADTIFTLEETPFDPSIVSEYLV